MRQISLSVFAVCLAICGCKSHPTYLKREYKTIDMAAASQRADLPMKLFEMVAAKQGISGEQPIKDLSRGKDLFPFDLYFFTDGGTGEKGQLKFRFTKGGGQLDLADYSEILENSSIRLGLVPRLEGEYEGFSTIFYSRTKKVEVDHGSMGLGCNILLDISKLFSKAIHGDGWKISTVNHRHLESLQGTFVFSLKNEDKVKIAQVTIIDSSRPQTICGKVPKKAESTEEPDAPTPTVVPDETEAH